jgi:hypothetical protein
MRSVIERGKGHLTGIIYEMCDARRVDITRRDCLAVFGKMTIYPPGMAVIIDHGAYSTPPPQGRLYPRGFP